MKKTTMKKMIALLLLALISTWANAQEKEHADNHGHEERESGEDHDHDSRHGEQSHGNGHEDHDGHGGQEDGAVDAELNDEQRRMAGIETLAVRRQAVGTPITAPGEVKLNTYRTTKVTPRIAAQVQKRHVQLGDHVKKDQALVTLSSVDMAQAQGALLEAETELRRVEKLGRKVVSEKRFVAAQVAYQQTHARVRAYGMTPAQIEKLIQQGDAANATGEFQLLSYQDGTVINDDFVVGELVDPGHVLLQISDESSLWVEARLTPEDAASVAIGAAAKVKAGDRWLAGKVAQARHALDETTRTLAVHVEVPNPDDRLHPGQFVNVVIEGRDQQQGIAVPLASLLRGADGDWQVFVQTAPGRFEPREVEVLQTVGDQVLIEGVTEGTTIVSKGAFFVQSEIAKSGFEVHNH
jgi:RND family efflux transporter MFP subunit